MAEAGTSDPPSITTPQSPELPSGSKSPKTETERTELMTQVSSDDNEPRISSSTSSSTVIEQDDEVQFIFCAPRRRKKKRKIFEAFPSGSDSAEGSEVPAESPTTPSTAGSSQRVSTSKAETLQIGSTVRRDDSTSHPTMHPNIDMNPKIRSSSFTGSNTNSSASSPEWMPGWRGEPLPLLNSYDAQHNWIPIPNKNNPAMKRKWEGMHEVAGPCPLTRPLASPLPEASGRDPFGRINSTSGISLETSNVQPSFTNWLMNPAVLPWQNYNRGARTGSGSAHGSPLGPFPAINARQHTGIGSFWPDPSPFLHASMQQPARHLSLQNSSADQQGIQVPVSQVPDQSVSPRTKTVRICQPSSPVSIPQCPLSALVPSPPSRNVTQRLIGSFKESPEQLVCQPLSPQDSRPASTSSTVTFRPSPTLPSDLRRKPSLYTIPPWTPPNAAGLPQSNSSSVSMTGCRHEGEIRGNCLDQGPAIDDAASLIFSGQYKHSKSRKHAPNIIVDIAETCQQNFPFAAVAERHRQPIQKVFDIFSAIIQIPLLRHASDNRRNGSLGRKRMKEFKDAKKAMNKAQEEECKNLEDAAQGQPPMIKDAGKTLKKAKKTQGLLKAAILNNAREKKANAV